VKVTLWVGPMCGGALWGLVGSHSLHSCCMFFLSRQKSSMDRWPSPNFPDAMQLKHRIGQSHSSVRWGFEHLWACCSAMWLGIPQMWQRVYVGGCWHCSVACDRTWHLAHWQYAEKRVAKPTLIHAPYMKVGLRMMFVSFRPRSERRKVNAPMVASGLARVALVQTGPSMGVHALYGRLRPNSSHSCLDVGSVPSGPRWIGTP
jgi:hypothetical protein